MSVQPDAATEPAEPAVATPAIRATGLRKRYPGVDAVDGLDLTIAPGESFGFLGPNGAGKTTTIAMLCTLAVPTSGRIEIAGHDTRTDAAAARRRIGLIFQETTLDGQLTAAENLRFHADLYNVPAERVPARIEETLALVGLTDCRDQVVHTFSGGMRRRLEIARALLHRPQILFLDEPTIGLDPNARAQVWRHLRHVCENEAVTLFLTTHYLEEAEQCDRIAIIDAGRVVAQGSPAELKSVLGADRVDLRTGDDAAAALLIGERLGLDVTRGGRGLYFQVPDGARVLPRLLTELDVPVYEARVTSPTLDDVFLHHTGHRIRDDAPLEPPSAPDAPDAASRAVRVAAESEPGRGGLRAELRAMGMVWRREMLHFRRDRLGAVISLIQPLMFLFILGVGLANLMPGPSGDAYQLFLFSGALVAAAQGPALAAGSSIMWDRQGGFLREMLAGPVSRSSLLVGKCLGGTTLATCQGGILLTTAGLVGAPLDGVLVLLLLGELVLVSLTMTILSVLLSTLISRPQTFGTVLTVIMAPLVFLSGSFFPLSAMPPWMAVPALANPLTYAVDMMRRTVTAYAPGTPSQLFRPLSLGPWHPPVLFECGLLAALTAGGLIWAARRFSRLA
ncbi:ATP-binding cassette domain-containing protein [Actinomadura macra]|uniref:ATP-binding cassette domain-containing protein n=1 Tax=Actinomadura macra TaxID=46164 RepID=UPI00082CCC88|nr:ATP-binding cassette domain-containing protein [Actinomadura macra]